MNRHQHLVAKTTHWKGAFAAVLLLLVPAGCSTTDAKSVSTTEPATTTSPSTSTSTTSTSTTTTTTTTTTLPDPCAGFNALTLSGQMQQVRDNTAPTDPACAPAVTNATQAVAAFDQGVAFRTRRDEEIAQDKPFGKDTVFDLTSDCNTSMEVTLTNQFTSLLLVWGYFYSTGPDDDVSQLRPMIGPIVPPGQSAVASTDLPSSVSCAWQGALAIGSDSYRPFDQPNSGAPDNPQASDDPAVWFPALQEQLNIARANGSTDYLIDHVYDLHSDELYYALSRQATEPAAPAALTLCQSLDVEAPEGLNADWKMLLLSGISGFPPEKDHYFLGLFSRGTDGYWRIMTLGLGFPYPYDPAAPCSGPPLI